jgi:D-glycero-D-manno-heptose 1,7-bisphosphate phosphatase
MREMKETRLLVVDVDGTLIKLGNKDGQFVNKASDVELFPGVINLLLEWKAGNGRILAVSNQGGIALGFTTSAEVKEKLEHVNELTGNLIDVIVWCPHHPSAPAPPMVKCWCRKPSPGLIVAAVINMEPVYGERYPSYLALMVGDMESDKQCAELAGMDFMWASEWRKRGSEG